MSRPWTSREVELIVADYFSMLQKELSGIKLNKTVHRNQLMEKLDGRSKGSIEMKHQNISAALIDLGVPYVQGYKPLGNYQKVIPEIIVSSIELQSDLIQLLSSEVSDSQNIPSVDDYLSILVDKPDTENYKPKSISESIVVPNTKRPNYFMRELRNGQLGAVGEKFAINYEKARLIAAGREALSEKIEHVSITEGDSAGYDVRSYEENGKDRFIEVKTTRYGIHTPFYITPNELNYSESFAESYYVYRVFNFSKETKVYFLPGNVRHHVELVPVSYRATL